MRNEQEETFTGKYLAVIENPQGEESKKMSEKKNSLLSQVTRGKIVQPFLGITHGVEGVGKSTLAASMPKPIFMGAEKGTANLDVHRLPPIHSFQDVLNSIRALIDEPHDFKSLAIDSLDWIEPLVWEHVVFQASNSKIKSIEDFGYGKGYVYALDEWRKFIAAIDLLRDRRKMNVMMIGHSQVKTAKDPTVVDDYERYQLKLNEKAGALLSEFVDCVFFANFETLTAKDAKGKTRALGDGARYLYTEQRPGFKAKNRFGLPFKLPLEWASVQEALESSNPQDPEVLIRQINGVLEELKDDTTKAIIVQTVEASKADSSKLERILNKVRTLVAA